MSYYIDSLPCGEFDFKIRKENFKSIIEAFYEADLKFMNERPNEWEFYHGSKECRPYDDIDDLFGKMGYFVYFDDCGNIENICLDHESYRNEYDDFMRMAPWVEPGSKLDFIGEDYSIWRYFFNGETMVQVEGQVVFPDVPVVRKENAQTGE